MTNQMKKDKNAPELTRSEKAYICYNILQGENKNIASELELPANHDALQELYLQENITSERIQELNGFDSNYMITNYSKYSKEDTETNPFVYCVHKQYPERFQVKKSNKRGEWKANCKDLLVEAIKIYCTPFKEEYYLKISENQFIYIGNDWEDYLERLYTQLTFEFRAEIPFNTIIKRIQEGRIYEKLEPQRKYILFNDCLLNIETGTTEEKRITRDTIPYAIIEENYKQINTEAQKYVSKLFNRIGDDNNRLISLLCGLFNKKLLGKGAIFNIQKSGMGKTLLLKPLVELGLCANVNHDMLTGNERAGLFRQYYSVIFEEIQDTVINGSAFNALVDNVSMQVQRKYKKDITIKKEYKPVVFINGESLADFRGRTRGTFNRFRFMPQFKEALTEDDYEYIEENLTSVGIEIIRHLMNYIQAVGQETITDNIKQTMKEEKEIFDLKENKLNIIFEYIKESPELPNNSTHCVSKKILREIIKELQSRGEITVDLFNSDNSINRFINKNIIPSLEIDEVIIPEENKRRSIYQNGKWATAVLVECLQLTEKGEAIVTDLSYKLSSLTYKSK